jgi:ABC-type sugar transport system permease subunit
MLVAPLVSRAARRRWRRVRAAVPGYAFIAPAMAGIVLFGLAPLVYAFVVSLHAYDLVNRHPPFVGPANYSRLLTDPVFWGALRNTLVYTVMLVPLQTATGLGLALLVQQPTRWIALLRTAYFLPVVISYVVAAGLWQVLFATPNGPMNSLLALVRIPPQLFFLSQTQALPLIALMSAWKWSGVSMLVYLGGLHEIPLELYEASRVDGAGALRQFSDITWPLLRRVTLFVVVVNTIDAFKIFTPVYVITQGGPMDATMVLVYHLFREGFRYFHLGYASAISFVLLLLVLVLAVVQFRVLREAPQ